MDDKNLIPAAYAAGSFEAISPFNAVVDPSVYYTVEAVRTVDEMLSNKTNIYDLVFKPVGVQESDYETILKVVGAKDENFVLTRNRDYIEVLHNNEEKGYSLCTVY